MGTEVILSSGRVLRFRDATTEDVIDAQERASADAMVPASGDGAADRAARQLAAVRNARLVIQYLFCALLEAVTEPVEWGPILAELVSKQQGKGKGKERWDPPAADLIAAVPESLWHPVTEGDLIVEGPLHWRSLLRKPADWTIASGIINGMLAPDASMLSLAGKARTTTGG